MSDNSQRSLSTKEAVRYLNERLQTELNAPGVHPDAKRRYADGYSERAFLHQVYSDTGWFTGERAPEKIGAPAGKRGGRLVFFRDDIEAFLNALLSGSIRPGPRSADNEDHFPPGE